MSLYDPRTESESEKFSMVLGDFTDGLTASETAQRSGINTRVVEEFFRQTRNRIREFSWRTTPVFEGQVQVDTFDLASPVSDARFERKEFEAVRPKLVAVLGRVTDPFINRIMGRDTRLYVTTIPDEAGRRFFKIIEDQVVRSATIYASDHSVLQVLSRLGWPNVVKVNSLTEHGLKNPDVNPYLGDFWEFLRQRLSRMRGVRASTFFPFLKECELRWNHGWSRDEIDDTLYKSLAEMTEEPLVPPRPRDAPRRSSRASR